MSIMKDMTRDVVYEQMDDISKLAQLPKSDILDIMDEMRGTTYKMNTADLLDTMGSMSFTAHGQEIECMILNKLIWQRVSEDYDCKLDGVFIKDSVANTGLLTRYFSDSFDASVTVNNGDDGYIESVFFTLNNFDRRKVFEKRIKCEYSLFNYMSSFERSLNTNFTRKALGILREDILKQYNIEILTPADCASFSFTSANNSANNSAYNYVKKSTYIIRQSGKYNIKSAELWFKFCNSFAAKYFKNSKAANKNISLLNYSANSKLPIYSIKDWVDL